jgi:hypothetical protein
LGEEIKFHVRATAEWKKHALAISPRAKPVNTAADEVGKNQADYRGKQRYDSRGQGHLSLLRPYFCDGPVADLQHTQANSAGFFVEFVANRIGSRKAASRPAKSRTSSSESSSAVSCFS